MMPSHCSRSGGKSSTYHQPTGYCLYENVAKNSEYKPAANVTIPAEDAMSRYLRRANGAGNGNDGMCAEGIGEVGVHLQYPQIGRVQ